MQKRVVAVVVAALVVLALVGSLELGYLPVGGGTSTTTACATCGPVEPVVDVIMPALGTSANIANPNRVINMSLGATQTFEVDVYPTAPLNFTMGFRSVLASSTGTGGQGGAPAATFQPSELSVGANEKGVTFMTIFVPSSSATGTYDTVVSATDPANSSQVWGLYFQVDVS